MGEQLLVRWSRVGSRVKRNVTARVSGTPVCDTSGSSGSRFGTGLMVPKATDNAANYPLRVKGAGRRP